MEQARPQIVQGLTQEAMQEIATELRQDATIVFYDAGGNPIPEGGTGQSGGTGSSSGTSGTSGTSGNSGGSDTSSGSGTTGTSGSGSDTSGQTAPKN